MNRLKVFKKFCHRLVCAFTEYYWKIGDEIVEKAMKLYPTKIIMYHWDMHIMAQMADVG